MVQGPGSTMTKFEMYLLKWNLIPDGQAIVTPSSHLLPVKYNQEPCMLKIALIQEEQIGGDVMLWWDGQGAAKILAHDEKALLMQRATGSGCLQSMVKQNQDDEASRILCSVIAKLHAVSHKTLPSRVVPLTQWFRSLNQAAEQYGGVIEQASLVSQTLLQNQQEITILHGDIHHQNILDFGNNQWLAIDPKGLIGERYFDYANLFCNPDYETATRPGRLDRQAHLISAEAGLDYHRLLQWILAYAGLSASWHLEEGSNPDLAIKIAELSSSLLAS